MHEDKVVVLVGLYVAGDELEITAEKVVNKTMGKSYAAVPLPRARQAIIDAGGLIAYTRKRVMEAAGKA